MEHNLIVTSTYNNVPGLYIACQCGWYKNIGTTARIEDVQLEMDYHLTAMEWRVAREPAISLADDSALADDGNV